MNFDEKKSVLDNVFYKHGKQAADYELCIMSKEDDEVKATKWRKYSTLAFDTEDTKNQWFIQKVNNRTILPNEVVLDLEDPELYENVLAEIDADGLYYEAYKTGSKGYHFHLFFDRDLTEAEKTEIIKKYGCDLQKAGDRCMIALELEDHWKTGNPKELIKKNTGINRLPKQEVKEINMFEEGIGKFTNKLELAKEFYKIQPIIYDRHKIWWLWDFKEFKWTQVDEIDILNKIDDAIEHNTGNTVDSKIKNEIIESLRRIGRKNMPKEPEKTWVQFKDKIVDIKTGEIFEATPEYFMTNPIPWKLGDSEETPTMDKFFGEWVVMEGLQDKTFIDTLYEIICYSSLNHQFLQRLFAFTGEGSNGKGCFCDIIKKFIGIDNICTSELKLLSNNNFETSGLYKKQACFMEEVDSYDMQNTNLLKKLTGENDVRYEFKGKTQFSERSATTCIISTNALPVTPDQSDGFYRRWLIVDFPHKFPVGRDILSEIPEIEFENLALKCINICKKLYENKKFTNEGNIEARKLRYEARSNPLMKFIERDFNENPDDFMILSDFVKMFNTYLKENRLRQMKTKAISKALREEGFAVKGKKAYKDMEERFTTCIYGIKPKEKKEIKIVQDLPDIVLSTGSAVSWTSGTTMTVYEQDANILINGGYAEDTGIGSVWH